MAVEVVGAVEVVVAAVRARLDLAALECPFRKACIIAVDATSIVGGSTKT